MKRWNSKKGEFLENPRVDEFLNDVLTVYEKHGLSIGLGDWGGAFVVEKFSEQNEDWLMGAQDRTEE